MNRIKQLDSLKFLLIIFVIFGHLLELTKTNLWLRDFIYIFHMPIFVFITGFTFKKYLGNHNIFFIFKKSLVPFIFFQIIYSIFSRNIYLHIPYYHLWFIYSLFFWYIFTNIFSKSLFKGFIIAIILVFLGSFSKYYGYPFGIGRTLTFLPFFILGSMYSINKNYFHSKKMYLDIFIILIGSIFLFKYNNLFFNLDALLKGSFNYSNITLNNSFGLIFKGFYYVITISYIYFIINLFINFDITYFNRFGKDSYYYYIYHVFFIFSLIKILKILNPKLITNINIFLLIIFTIFTILFCFIVKNIIFYFKKNFYEKFPSGIKLFLDIHP